MAYPGPFAPVMTAVEASRRNAVARSVITGQSSENVAPRCCVLSPGTDNAVLGSLAEPLAAPNADRDMGEPLIVAAIRPSLATDRLTTHTVP